MSKGTALITGASSGIGAALARQFASKDFDLIITARRESNLRDLARELPGKIHVIACDLSTPEGPHQLARDVETLGIQVDVLVNNAGVAISGDFAQSSESDSANMIALNVAALTELTHAFLPGMIKRGSGRILNVASVAGFQPVPSMSVYAASKAFVLSFSEGLSEELRGTGVSITALCPGLTRTDMVESLNAELIPPFLMSSVEQVAREGYEALMNKEVIRIPGIANQAAITWSRFQPRWLVRGLGGLVSRLNPSRR